MVVLKNIEMPKVAKDAAIFSSYQPTGLKWRVRFDLKRKCIGHKYFNFAALQMDSWKERNKIKKKWIHHGFCDYPLELGSCYKEFEKKTKRLIACFRKSKRSNPHF